MTTEDTLDPSLATPETEPLPTETVQPSEQEPTESVEELKKKLAAAETEAQRWKGRVEKATKTAKKEGSISEEDLDWKIANVDRIKLVKDTYQKELDELAATGAKVTNELREKALKLAEASSNIRTAAPSDSSFPAPEVDRSGGKPITLNPYAKAMNVKQETIEKFKDYVEGV